MRIAYVVMKLLGPSLEDLLNFCGGKFSLKTALMLFKKAVEKLACCEHKTSMLFLARFCRVRVKALL